MVAISEIADGQSQLCEVKSEYKMMTKEMVKLSVKQFQDIKQMTWTLD